MSDKLNEIQIAEYKESFSLYDKTGSGKIPIKKFADLIRSLNYNPTNLELEEMIKAIDPESTGLFDFPDFLALVAQKPKVMNPEEELLEAFRILDRDKTGFIRTKELRHVVSHMGEVFNEEETEAICREADPNDTKDIRYADFIKKITSKFIFE